MILLHSTISLQNSYSSFFFCCALLALLASLSHGHLVTTECLYLALLYLLPIFTRFTGSLSLSVDRCCISLPIYYSNDFTYSATRQQDALIHLYQRTENCIILRASEPGNIQTLRWANTNWVHTNAKKTQSSWLWWAHFVCVCISFFFLWCESPKDVNIFYGFSYGLHHSLVPVVEKFHFWFSNGHFTTQWNCSIVFNQNSSKWTIHCSLWWMQLNNRGHKWMQPKPILMAIWRFSVDERRVEMLFVFCIFLYINL